MQTGVRTGVIEELKKFFDEHPDFKGIQAFNCPSAAPDYQETVYKGGEFIINYCEDWGYIDILGISQDELDVLDELGLTNHRPWEDDDDEEEDDQSKKDASPEMRMLLFYYICNNIILFLHRIQEHQYQLSM